MLGERVVGQSETSKAGSEGLKTNFFEVPRETAKCFGDLGAVRNKRIDG